MKGTDLAVLLIFIDIAFLILPAVGIWGSPNTPVNFGSIFAGFVVSTVLGLGVAGISAKYLTGSSAFAGAYWGFFFIIWGIGSTFLTSSLSTLGISGLFSWAGALLLGIGSVLATIGAFTIATGVDV